MAMTTISRRSLITGLISFVAAPAIVRVGSLMPVKVIEDEPILAILPSMWRDLQARWSKMAEIEEYVRRESLAVCGFYQVGKKDAPSDCVWIIPGTES